jgi:hypothetical protein
MPIDTLCCDSTHNVPGPLQVIDGKETGAQTGQGEVNGIRLRTWQVGRGGFGTPSARR